MKVANPNREVSFSEERQKDSGDFTVIKFSKKLTETGNK